MARPREFDTELVLNAARDLFWQRGYRGTSLDELSAITGVRKPSLYGAFGDKSQLFLTVLERYHAVLLAVAQQMLGGDTSGTQAVRTWLLAFVPCCSDTSGERGCMSVNTSMEASELVPEVRASIDAFQRTLQATIQAALKRAVDQGELPASYPCEANARVLMVAQSGFMALAGACPPASATQIAMERLLDALLPANPTQKTGAHHAPHRHA